MPDVLDRLGAAGLLQESDGALVVFPPGFTNREGDPLPLIVRSRAGAFTYATSDLACVIDRVERVGADVMLYVVGAEQGQHLQMVFAVSAMAGWLVPPRRAEHVSFGLVLGTDHKTLRSRSGGRRGSSTSSTRRSSGGRGGGGEESRPAPGAACGGRPRRRHRRGEVRRPVDRSGPDYVFDWDRMLSFDGNTAPYLQYAHARICSIFRRAGIDRSPVRTPCRYSPNPPSGRWRCGSSPSGRRWSRPPTGPAPTGWRPTSTTWRRTSRRSTSTAPC